MASINLLVPERAIVPRLSIKSCRDIPIPLSSISTILFFLETRILIFNSFSFPKRPFLERASYLNFSQASAEFEISSRRNISLSLYKELAIKSRSLLTSAWKTKLSLLFFVSAII